MVRQCIALFIALQAFLSGCSTDGRQRPMQFEHKGNTLSGTLYLPKGNSPYPLVVITHGDGEIPRDAFGYYKPFIKLFNQAGYVVASWDKPGVGKSTGNWLEQSMDDRATELLAGIDQLRTKAIISKEKIGLLGFSQAGWVMPTAMIEDDRLSFMISVSTAINWHDQGRFLMTNRLQKEGYDNTALLAAFEFDSKVDRLLKERANYEDYLNLMANAPACCNAIMSAERWSFVSLNHQSDSTNELTQISKPMLFLFGNKDLNVNTQHNINIIKEIFSRNNKTTPCHSIVSIENADHSLLPAKQPRISTGNIGMLGRLLKIELFGANAFAEGSLTALSEWLNSMDSEKSGC